MARIEIKVPNWIDRVLAWPAVVYRKLKYGYTYRRIYLGEGKYAEVDAEDYYKLNNFRWCVNGEEGKFYAVRFDNSNGKKQIVSMHGEIMKAPKGKLVDHRNRKSLDNRSENLRIATHSQNQCNRGKVKKKTSSKYIGVYFDKQTGRWGARIHSQGKKIWLGRFKEEEEAARAYDEAAKKYHGEFAHLNFVQNTDCHPFSLCFAEASGRQHGQSLTLNMESETERETGIKLFSVVRFLLSILGFY